MNVPRLNRRLTLETPGRVADGAGGFEQTWAALGVVWAQVKARSGREVALGAASLASVPYTVTVRAAPVGDPQRPVPEQRFRDGARVFHILTVAEADPDGRYLTCLTEEEVVT